MSENLLLFCSTASKDKLRPYLLQENMVKDFFCHRQVHEKLVIFKVPVLDCRINPATSMKKE